MKKLPAVLSVLFLAVCLLCPAVWAEPSLGYVHDDAGLLSAEEQEQLTEGARSASEETGCGVYILTVDDPYAYTEASHIEEAAGNFYFDYGYGEGGDGSGILLLIASDERKLALYAYGYGNTAFTDYGKQALIGEIKSYLGEDDWYGGFSAFINESRRLILLAQSGTPLDEPEWPIQPEERFLGVIFCLILGLIGAFIIRSVLRRQLRSVAFETNANAFICDSSMVLTDHEDRYTHTTTSRRYDPPDNDKSSGGTTTDSRGGSSASSSF